MTLLSTHFSAEHNLNLPLFFAVSAIVVGHCAGWMVGWSAVLTLHSLNKTVILLNGKREWSAHFECCICTCCSPVGGFCFLSFSFHFIHSFITALSLLQLSFFSPVDRSKQAELLGLA